jgi:hypothetical protein
VALYTERSKALIIVAVDPIVSISARNESNDSNSGKRSATEIHSIAVQKFLSEVTELSERNVDHFFCVNKITFY